MALANTSHTGYHYNNSIELDIFLYNDTDSGTITQFEDNDDDPYGDNYVDPKTISSLSDTQEKILALLPVIPALLSILGSASILHLIFIEKKHSPFRRILVGMSCADIISSLTTVIQPYMAPRDSSQFVWASGTDSTCTFIGAMQQLSFASYWYAGILSCYFVLIIRYGWREERFAHRMEPMMHLVAIMYPLGTAIWGAVIGLYHELEVGPGCWIVNYPENCGTKPGKSGETCTSTYYAYGFAAFPVLMVLFFLVGNHISIYRHVKKTTLRTSFSNLRGENASRRQTKAVATQAFLYVGAFLSCYLSSVILRALEARPVSMGASDQDRIFSLLCLQMIFLPSQGTLNLIVFLRPRINLVKQEFKRENYWWVVRRAMYGESVQPTSRTMGASPGSTAPNSSGQQSSSLSRSRQQNVAVPGGGGEETQTYNIAEEIAALPEEGELQEDELPPRTKKSRRQKRVTIIPEDVSAAFSLEFSAR